MTFPFTIRGFVTPLILCLCLCVAALAQSHVAVGIGFDNSTKAPAVPVFTVGAEHSIAKTYPLSVGFRGVYGNNVADTQASLKYTLLPYRKLTPFVGAGFDCVDRIARRCHPLIELGARLPRSQSAYWQWFTPVTANGQWVTEQRLGYSVDLPLMLGVFSKNGRYFTQVRGEWQFVDAEVAATRRSNNSQAFRLSVGIGRWL